MNKGTVMNNMLVIEQDRTAHLAKGWGLSIALHGCLILAVMSTMPKLTLTVEQEPFRWDVALVEAPAPASPVAAPAPLAQAPAAAKSPQAKPWPAPQPEPAPQVVMRTAQPQEPGRVLLCGVSLRNLCGLQRGCEYREGRSQSAYGVQSGAWRSG